MPPRPKKFICTICKNGEQTIDYKNPGFLANYITYYRSIQSRFHTGICPKHQKQIAAHVKRARGMGLLPAVRYEK